MERIIKPSCFIGVILLASFTYGSADARFVYPDPEISIENLKRTVHYLSTISPPRNYTHLESLEKSVQYISQKFIEYGLTPERQKFEVAGNIYGNVIASAGQSKAFA